MLILFQVTYNHDKKVSSVFTWANFGVANGNEIDFEVRGVKKVTGIESTSRGFPTS